MGLSSSRPAIISDEDVRRTFESWQKSGAYYNRNDPLWQAFARTEVAGEMVRASCNELLGCAYRTLEHGAE